MPEDKISERDRPKIEITPEMVDAAMLAYFEITESEWEENATLAITGILSAALAKARA